MNIKNKQFINDETAEKVVNMIDSALGKKITDILGREYSKDMIRFHPVGEECGKIREQKGLSVKQIATQMKIPQYRLKAVEKSDLTYIQPTILECYIDFLGMRIWFNAWVRENTDVYNRLGKR